MCTLTSYEYSTIILDSNFNFLNPNDLQIYAICMNVYLYL